MGCVSAWHRIACRVALASVAVLATSLVGCAGFQFERHSVLELQRSGDLHRAREVLADLVLKSDEPSDRVALEQLDSELAAHHYTRARGFLRRGFPDACYRELHSVLFFDPDHIAAKLLAEELWDAHEAHHRWRRELERSIDDGRWEDAVERVVSAPNNAYSSNHWRRAPELFRLAWDDFRARFEVAVGHGAVDDMNAAIAGGVAFADRYPDLRLESGVAVADDLERWRWRAQVLERGNALREAARRHRERGEHRRGYELLREALHYLAHDESLGVEIDRQRQDLCELHRSTMRHALDTEDWTVFTRARRALEDLGGAVPELGDPGTFETARARSVETLVAEARELRARDMPGNALLALAEALQLAPGDPDLTAELAGLREAVLAAPLLAVRDEDGEGGKPKLQPLTDLVVRKGSTEYREERASRMVRCQAGVEKVGAKLLDNPAYEAERKLVEESRREVERLQTLWMNASSLEKDHAHRRYLAGVAELERIEKRLEALPEAQPRVTWKRGEVSVETRELLATLEMPVTLSRPGAAPEKHRLEATLRHLDDHRPPDQARFLPGDPDELPSAQDARADLAVQLDARLETWLDELRRGIAVTLMERARGCHAEGATERAVELAVRALLEPAVSALGDDRGHRDGRRLLAAWTGRPERVLDLVFPKD